MNKVCMACFAVFLSIILLNLHSGSAFALTCERYQIDVRGFSNLNAAESYYPKQFVMDNTLFKPKNSSSKALVYDTNPSEAQSGTVHRMIITLLTNGKLIASLQAKTGYAKPGNAKYKCDLNSIEVAKLNKEVVSNNNQSGKIKRCSQSHIKNCSDTELCQKATILNEQNVIWASSENRLEFVKEAKIRNLSCNVSKSVGLDGDIKKAKGICIDLGFSEKTEKFGDCVLRIIESKD